VEFHVSEGRFGPLILNRPWPSQRKIDDAHSRKKGGPQCARSRRTLAIRPIPALVSWSVTSPKVVFDPSFSLGQCRASEKSTKTSRSKLGGDNARSSHRDVKQANLQITVVQSHVLGRRNFGSARAEPKKKKRRALEAQRAYTRILRERTARLSDM
jgi:hypothetical protein